MRIAIPSLVVAAPFLLTLSACSGAQAKAELDQMPAAGRSAPPPASSSTPTLDGVRRKWAYAVAALFILALLLGASPARAQDVIEPNKPFTVVADHDGVRVDGFHLFINGTVTATKTAAEVGCASKPCTVAFPVPLGLAAGTYTYAIDAFNATGATSTPVRTLAVTTLPTSTPPVAPTNLRITRQDAEPKPQQQ